MTGRAKIGFGALAVGFSLLSIVDMSPAGADPAWPSNARATRGEQTPTNTGGRWLTVSGRGFGHGVGMAQDGAYWMGRQGRSAAEILRHFYPGTSLGSKDGDVRVPLGGANAVTLTLGEGGSLLGRRIAPGGSVTVRTVDGELVAAIESATTTTLIDAGPSSAPALLVTPIAFRPPSPAAASDGATTVPPLVVPPSTAATIPADLPPQIIATAEPPAPEPGAEPLSEPAAVSPAPEPPREVPTSTTDVESAATTLPPDRERETIRGNPLVITTKPGGIITYGGKPYRGNFELRAQGGIRVVNELDVEQYLRGMGEVTDPRWPAAALQAQAIAARTYAFRTMASAGEVCPTQRCQVYVGVKAEYGAMDAAVEATRGKVVTYDKGKLAVTFYSASGGGTIATPEEAFGGTGDFPYLQAGTYLTGDLKSWEVTMQVTEVGRRLGYPGTPARIEITKTGPSGRAIEVTVFGDAPPLSVAGPRFDTALGLRSTLFTLSQSDAPPTAPKSSEDAATDDAVLGALDGSNEPIAFAQTGFFEVSPSRPGDPASPSRPGDPAPTADPVPSPKAASDQPVRGRSPASDQPVRGRSPASDQPARGRSPASDQPARGRSPASDQPVRGRSPASPPSTVEKGRLEQMPDQIALATATLQADGNHVGEIVFVGTLTLAGTVFAATLRRWLRSRTR